MISSNEYDWTFLNSNTREYTHIYHDYPARMIPQIPRQLLEILDQKTGNTLFDPYCGSGSTLVEAMIKGLNVIGCDINPLAILISKSKTDYSMDPIELSNEIERFVNFTLRPNGKPKSIEKANLNFWFKKNTIKAIGLILRYIDNIKNPSIKAFFKVAASETIRESSNTRKGEFKLYRYSKEVLLKHNPDPFAIMKLKLYRNLKGYQSFYDVMAQNEYKPISKLKIRDTTKSISKNFIFSGSVNIVITSPPYGDSHTTVAYGQYSRLSSEWLGILKENVDSLAMGGKPAELKNSCGCKPLDDAIDSIESINPKRAKEVFSFYVDLKKSIKNISKLIKDGGYSCYVVANRRVSGIQLPTDKAIQCFFESYGFYHENTFIRSIPNKRMPSRNSPSNKSGITQETMSKEYIVVMRK